MAEGRKCAYGGLARVSQTRAGLKVCDPSRGTQLNHFRGDIQSLGGPFVEAGDEVFEFLVHRKSYHVIASRHRCIQVLGSQLQITDEGRTFGSGVVAYRNTRPTCFTSIHLYSIHTFPILKI